MAFSRIVAIVMIMIIWMVAMSSPGSVTLQTAFFDMCDDCSGPTSSILKKQFSTPSLIQCAMTCKEVATLLSCQSIRFKNETGDCQLYEGTDPVADNNYTVFRMV